MWSDNYEHQELTRCTHQELDQGGFLKLSVPLCPTLAIEKHSFSTHWKFQGNRERSLGKFIPSWAKVLKWSIISPEKGSFIDMTRYLASLSRRRFQYRLKPFKLLCKHNVVTGVISTHCIPDRNRQYQAAGAGLLALTTSRCRELI